MTREAFKTVSDVYEKSTLTHQDSGINEKHTLIIPSFGTTSKIFAQHLSILRELKVSIERLYSAYSDERSEKESWRAIDTVLEIIEKAVTFLDF